MNLFGRWCRHKNRSQNTARCQSSPLSSLISGFLVKNAIWKPGMLLSKEGTILAAERIVSNLTAIEEVDSSEIARKGAIQWKKRKPRTSWNPEFAFDNGRYRIYRQRRAKVYSKPSRSYHEWQRLIVLHLIDLALPLRNFCSPMCSAASLCSCSVALSTSFSKATWIKARSTHNFSAISLAIIFGPSMSVPWNSSSTMFLNLLSDTMFRIILAVSRIQSFMAFSFDFPLSAYCAHASLVADLSPDKKKLWN